MEHKSDDNNRDKEAFLRSLGFEGQQLSDLLGNKKISEAIIQMVKEAKITTCDKETRTLLLHTAEEFKKLSPDLMKYRSLIVNYILSKKIKNKLQIQAAAKFIHQSKGREFELSDFEKAAGVGVEYSPETIASEVKKAIDGVADELPTKRYQLFTKLMTTLTERMPFCPTGTIKAELEKQLLALIGERTEADKAPPKQTQPPKKKIEEKANDEVKLKESIVFSDPKDNIQERPEILAAHLQRTGGKVVTRFPPEPNGYLHIGHAKAMNLSFGYAKKMGGVCYLRFDDTNPEKESKEYIDSIIETVAWMGHKPWKITYASDYFQQLYDFAVELIKKGKAYVCHQTKQEIAEGRAKMIPSPWRDTPVEVNLKKFEDMRKGKYEEGKATLRVKIDMKHPNPNMRDFVAYRIKYVPHPHAGDKWCIYPSYDYTHCINDSLEDITHSLCTLEFETRREPYFWLLDALGLYKPVVWEYGRLNLTYTVLSKRKLIQLVNEGHVKGWDDPRMPTLVGYRRRGYTPEAINNFCEAVGVTRNMVVTIDMGVLEEHVRDHLNIVAPRRMAVLDPLKVTITNWTEGVKILNVPDFPNDPKKGTHTVPFSNVIYIERSDFREEDIKDFYGLALKTKDSKPKWVGLKYAYSIHVFDVKRDASGKIIELLAKYDAEPKKVKGHLHWVAQPSPGQVSIELRASSNMGLLLVCEGKRSNETLWIFD
jgi:glutaminyl-tRNA synthetase